MNQINMALDMFALIICAIMIVGTLSEYAIHQRLSKLFIFSLFCLVIYLINSWIMFFLYQYFGTERIGWYHYLLDYLDSNSSTAYYAILILFTCYIREYLSFHCAIPRYLITITIVVGSVYAGLWTISAFNGMFIDISGDGIEFGKLYILGQFGSYIIIIINVIMMIIARKHLQKNQKTALFTFVFFPVLGVVLKPFMKDIALMPLALLLSLFSTFIHIHLSTVHEVQRKENEMAEARMRILLSQVTPHFLYNSLNSIYYLCEKNPSEAQQAIEDFSEYLRINIDSMTKEKLVNISKEIEHVRYYLRLEKVRFQDELNVEYEIENKDFMIPPFTLEPIVENAVRHGISKKEGGGTVKIYIGESVQNYIVRIEDDGVGFNSSEDITLKDESERGHIGIQNVRDRLWYACEGTLKISSHTGAGTKVEIHLPKARNHLE